MTTVPFDEMYLAQLEGMTESLTAHSLCAPHGYDDLVTLANKTGQSLKSLVALSKDNDPYYCGTPAHRAAGEWFGSVFARAQQRGLHLRRLHYLCVSWGDVTLPDGTPYRNTGTAWKKLIAASACARYLGLIPPTALADARTPDPSLNVSSRPAPDPTTTIPWFEPLAVPSLTTIRLTMPFVSFLPAVPDYALPQPEISGYDYDPADQPYHLEVWIEKSTMTDILVPLCWTAKANLVTGMGTASITSVIRLLERAARHGKAVRIFYVSDFDRDGYSMPTGVARQVEFWRDQYAPDVDIKLRPLVLTRSQVDAYELPNAPGESADHNAAFEARQGRGVVELDALEALRPGTLTQIVREALAPYRDPTLAERLGAAQAAAQTAAANAWREQTAPVVAALQEAQRELAQIRERYQPELLQVARRLREAAQPFEDEVASLRQRAEAETEPIRTRTAAIEAELAALTADFHPELPERPAPERLDDNDEPWLYDSSRDYVEQIAWYQRH